MKRANFYIDGFNLYHGMVSAGYSHCKWLDINQLAMRLKNASHNIMSVKYFTSAIKNDLEKQKRQNAYLEALRTTPVEIILGQFRSEETKCNVCGENFFNNKEKMTDVNIATNLMIDAFKDRFDVGFVISGDSDLVPPIAHVRDLFPGKEIIVALPPDRESNALRKVANSSFVISKKKLEQCQLPVTVENKYGDIINKPKLWI